MTRSDGEKRVLPLRPDTPAGECIRRDQFPGERPNAGNELARLGAAAPEAMFAALRLLAKGGAPRVPQDNMRATLAPKLNREQQLSLINTRPRLIITLSSASVPLETAIPYCTPKSAANFSSNSLTYRPLVNHCRSIASSINRLAFSVMDTVPKGTRYPAFLASCPSATNVDLLKSDFI